MRVPVLIVALPCAALAVAAPAAADVLIAVDKASQRMSVSVDGAPRYTWAVSTGMEGYGTPSGSYRPFRMEKTHFSREWDNAPMPHAIFFTSAGHAIHGTSHVRQLGRTASHGCVRLSPRNAATLFGLVKAQGLGSTRVTIAGGETPVAARKGPGLRQARRRGRSPYEAGGLMSAGMQMGVEQAGGPGRRAHARVRSRLRDDPDYGYGLAEGDPVDAW